MVTEGAADAKGELKVNTAHFKKGLRQAKSLRAFEGQPGQITFDGQSLRIAMGGFSFSAKATGFWTGEVLVADSVLSRLADAARYLTRAETMDVSTDGRELRIANISFRCEWNALEYPRVELPIGASLSDILAIAYGYSETDIRRSGLWNRLMTAESKRDRLIAEAVKLLRKAGDIVRPLGFRGENPLGIGEGEIRKMLDEHLRAHATKGDR